MHNKRQSLRAGANLPQCVSYVSRGFASFSCATHVQTLSYTPVPLALYEHPHSVCMWSNKDGDHERFCALDLKPQQTRKRVALQKVHTDADSGCVCVRVRVCLCVCSCVCHPRRLERPNTNAPQRPCSAHPWGVGPCRPSLQAGW